MKVGRTVEYEDGDQILAEGSESDCNIYVLLDGQVKVTKGTEKGQATLALLEEGDVLGEGSFLAQRVGARSASAVAQGKVKLGILDHEKLAAEYKNLSPIFQKMLKDLSERFSKTTLLASRLASRRMDKPSLERREIKRSSVVQALRVRVDYLSDTNFISGTYSGTETYRGVLLDLASSGLGLELFSSNYSEATHSLGAKFIFQFTLPDKPMIRVQGHLVWVRALGGNKARMGVKFTETNPYLNKVIQEFLQSLSGT
ncbi:MAG: cyclic nucleotide-binding domain-containing protein [Deltaproteobacteria bacterium]|nr:MAG: cyclic nucleotide-binding domain-containing protein [Deltaproteobacteria bacterium]